MPRTLKRRSDAISTDDTQLRSPSPQPQRQHRRRMSETPSDSADVSSASGDEADLQSRSQTRSDTLIKKLVRLALACEYSRTPLRRSDISTKILKDTTSSRSFKPIFDGAQAHLQSVFGMQLVELPSREKTTLKDRRAQATQTKSTHASNSSKSWMLISILPDAYRQHPAIMHPATAGEEDAEASYTGIYTFIVSLIYLNNGSLAENKMGRYLKRVNAETMTPNGSLDKLLQRMRKEGYVEQRKEVLQGEEVVEWVVGPRGKVEVGAKGVAGLVRSLYGNGAVRLPNGVQKMEEDELNRKIKRSLGISVERNVAAEDADGEADELAVNGDVGGSAAHTGRSRRSARDRDDENEEAATSSRRPRRSTRRRGQDEEDEEGEEENEDKDEEDSSRRPQRRRPNSRSARSMIEDEAEAEEDDDEELEEDVEDDE